MLVQTFIPELAIKALDICILRRLTGLDLFQIYTMFISPLINRLVGEPGTLVSASGLRIIAEPGGLMAHWNYAFIDRQELR